MYLRAHDVAFLLYCVVGCTAGGVSCAFVNNEVELHLLVRSVVIQCSDGCLRIDYN